jgi:hypothetical protein
MPAFAGMTLTFLSALNDADPPLASENLARVQYSVGIER